MITSVATAGHEIKLALFELSRLLFEDDEDVHTSFGHPGFNRDRPDLVSWMDVRTEQEPGPMGNRARDENVYVSVTVSSYRAGEAEDDLVPEAAAFALLRRVEEDIRTTDPTLGGRAQWCFLDSLRSGGVTRRELLAKGRLIQIEAEFHARVRIRSGS